MQHTSVLATPVAEAADKPVPQVVNIDELIHQDSIKYGINYQHFYATLKCESENFKDVSIQSEVHDPNGPNGREDSWGLAQIWIAKGGHPEVTRGQAQDPVFAIDFAAHLFAIGQEHQLHCYDKEKAKDWK